MSSFNMIFTGGKRTSNTIYEDTYWRVGNSVNAVNQPFTCVKSHVNEQSFLKSLNLAVRKKLRDILSLMPNLKTLKVACSFIKELVFLKYLLWLFGSYSIKFYTTSTKLYGTLEPKKCCALTALTFSLIALTRLLTRVNAWLTAFTLIYSNVE